MKHGPIALIDENMPVVFIALKDSTYDKVLSNIQEVHARGKDSGDRKQSGRQVEQPCRSHHRDS